MTVQLVVPPALHPLPDGADVLPRLETLHHQGPVRGVLLTLAVAAWYDHSSISHTEDLSELTEDLLIPRYGDLPPQLPADVGGLQLRDRAPVGRGVDSEDGGELDVAQEDAEQEVHDGQHSSRYRQNHPSFFFHSVLLLNRIFYFNKV